MNLNKELHEAFGHKWNEPDGSIGSVIAYGIDHTMGNPDYVADPRLVIREMKKKGLLKRFLSSIGTTTNLDTLGKMSSLIAIDTSGKLAQLALDWLKEG